MKPLYDLLHDIFIFHWKIERETLFQQVQTSITKIITPKLANTSHPYLISVDSSIPGLGCVILQSNTKGKLDIVSKASRPLLLMSINSPLHIVK